MVVSLWGVAGQACSSGARSLTGLLGIPARRIHLSAGQAPCHAISPGNDLLPCGASLSASSSASHSIAAVPPWSLPVQTWR